MKIQKATSDRIDNLDDLTVSGFEDREPVLLTAYEFIDAYQHLRNEDWQPTIIIDMVSMLQITSYLHAVFRKKSLIDNSTG